MKWLAFLERSTVIVVFAVIFSCLCLGQTKQKVASDQDQAVRALQRYIKLRLNDADWKEYSKFITWPDEPSWDCKWVASKLKVGTPIRKGQEVLVPVVYSRLGLFCYDFDFKPEPKIVTLDYKLVQRPSGWKVNAPIPDYPDIGEDVLLKSLSAMADNVNETPERRTKARETVRQIREAQEHEATSSPRLRTH